MKSNKLERLTYAVHRAMTEPSSMGAAKWVLYGSAAITTILLFAADSPTNPKVPKHLGD